MNTNPKNGVTMDTQTVTDLIREVSDAIIMPRFRPGRSCSGDQHTKDDGSVVTYADVETERILTKTLSGLSPFPILGEEAAAAKGMSGKQAYEYADSCHELLTIDPLDGSRAYAEGRPNFAVMVAEKSAKQVSRVWLYLPVTREMFTVEDGTAKLNGEPLVPGLTPHTPTRGVSYVAPQSFNHPGFLCGRGSGSVGVDYTHVARGIIDFVGHRHPKPWDHLPGVTLVESLGGMSSLMPGGRILTASDPTTWATATQHLTTTTAALGYESQLPCACRLGTGTVSPACGLHA